MSDRPLHALLLPPGPALVDALAAALDGGPAVLPLDPAAPPATVERLLRASRPQQLVTPEHSRPLPNPAPVEPDVAVVVATSGSSGEPKAVELPAAAVRHSAAATLARLGAAPDDRWLCCLPTSHIAGVQVLVRSLVAGTAPVLHAGFSVEDFAGADAQLAAVVPTMLGRLLDARVDLTRWRAILLGGAAAPPALLEQARAAGARVVTTYGMSETCGGCVYDGVPLDGVGVSLGEDGRIRIAGPVLARGYRLRPELTARSFVEGGLITQDLGHLAPDGRLEVLGRADDVIVTGGVNVAPRAVADLLAGHPGVADVAVLGRPDPEWGERVVAVIVPREPSAPPALADLRAYVLDRAPRELAPRHLVVVERIPLLPSGKPDRAALGELAAAEPDRLPMRSPEQPLRQTTRGGRSD